MNRLGVLASVGAALLVGATTAQAAGKAYPDGHGGEVFFPMGSASFADALVSFEAGDPASEQASNEPAAALDTPDFESNGKDSYLTLGCTGELVLAFEDNALIDVPGPDLYVFEVGPEAEPTGLAVSRDGEDWTRVGRISGGKAEVDIGPYISAGGEYRYVKLVDLRQACGGRTPGADIDAVGALGSASRIALDSAVLFASGEHTLKPTAYAALDEALEQVGKPAESRVTVAGHTDSVGTAEDNRALSRRRAETVAGYLKAEGNFPEGAVTTQAHGESRPVASNETAEGRQRNRRVELTVRTTATDSGVAAASLEILGLWATRNHGILEFREEGGTTRASYTSDGGVLLGEFTSETVFEGFWVEDNSNRTCDSRKDGREHWGPIRLTFETPARERFTGAWGYCGDPADNRTWRGERLL